MANLYRTVDVASLNFSVRSLDGTGNNGHGGALNDTYDRVSPPSYPAGSDGSTWDVPVPPATNPADDPLHGSPRDISNKVMSTNADIPSSFGVNELFQFFGQLMTHDVASAEPGSEPISFTGGFLTRDAFDIVDGVRAPIDIQTSFFDLSHVYGPNGQLADLLRDPDSGRMLTGPGSFLPRVDDLKAAHPGADVDGILAANGFAAFGPPGAEFGGYVAGDARVNQQSGLTGMQTLFVLNHNWNADQIAAEHPDWSNDRVYELARALNVAEFEHIAYDEYVAKLVGANALGKYHGYKANVDPSIINEWTTAAFRFGHDEASSQTSLRNEDGSVFDTVTLGDNFTQSFGTGAINSSQTLERWLTGFMAQTTQEIDGKIANGVRNQLFGFGQDLAAIDIVRGDDHGVGSLNLVREGLNLSTYTSFDQFGSKNHIDSATLAALKDVYDNDINKLDTEVGGLMEKKVKGSMLGETFTILNVMQFENIRDGDKYWYENQFKGEPDLLAAIKHTTLADIIQRSTGIDYVYHDAFLAAPRVSGATQGQNDNDANNLTGTNKGELILGFGGIDTLHGKGGADDVYGGNDNDNVYGDNGNDRVYGEAGSDNVHGGGGNDYVAGGAGNDNLWGDGGRDTFYFVDGGNDHVKDFAKNERIDLSDYAEFQKFADVRAHMTSAGGSVVLNVEDGTIVLDHFNINKLGAGNFIYSEILPDLV